MRIQPMTPAAATILIAGLLLSAFGCGGDEPAATGPAPAPPPVEGTIVAVGDSLTAGYGLPEAAAYPALLEKRLQQAGYRYRVVNAGISGETSSGARSRMEWIMTLAPNIVILETGANDGLRGIDPALTRENIEAITDAFSRQGVVVVLAGMKMVKNMGSQFTAAFEEIYPAVAAGQGAILVPFFLEGVAGEPDLNQSDGIHPTAEGYVIVTEGIYPYVVKAIEKWREKRRQTRLPAAAPGGPLIS